MSTDTVEIYLECALQYMQVHATSLLSTCRRMATQSVVIVHIKMQFLTGWLYIHMLCFVHT